jgi:hypothetical protein
MRYLEDVKLQFKLVSYIRWSGDVECTYWNATAVSSSCPLWILENVRFKNNFLGFKYSLQVAEILHIH